MKIILRIFLVFALILTSLQANSQFTNDQINGSWLGVLNTGSVELRLVFNFSETDDGLLKATLDSPDQGAKDIALGEVSLDKDSIRIEAPLLRGFYLGKIKNVSTMEGRWNQAGRAFDLSLEKQLTAFELKRPQEPLPPYPYKEEEVSFQNTTQGFSLGGTLSLPEGEGPFPAVILVTGSGSQNRDEEIFGHKPFKVIADHLTRKGIAVLRYDDRGVASSGGSYVGATSGDHAIDARSALEYLQTRKEIDHSKTGVIGHSEGGMIAFMLASEYDDIAFIVSLAGPGVDGKTILLEQSEYISRLSGVEDGVMEDNRIVMDKVYDQMIAHDSYQDWSREVMAFTGTYYSEKGMNDYSEEDIEQIKNRLLAAIPEPSYAWLRYFVMFDPAPLLTSIKCPVLALNGEKDCQVLVAKNIKAIQHGLQTSGNSRTKAMILPGLNHLFQNCETGLPEEYGKIEETFDPKTLELMSEWILQPAY